MTRSPRASGLWDSYKLTTVEVHVGDKVLTEGQMQDLWNCDFYMITASNPFSRLLSEADNNARNEELHALLKEEFEEILDGVGKDLAGTWAEKGWVVRGGDEGRLILLAKKFEQNAIFKFTLTGREIIDCR